MAAKVEEVRPEGRVAAACASAESAQCLGPDHQPRTIRTPARVWIDRDTQLRFEIRQAQDGCRRLCVSRWVRAPDGWHQRIGGFVFGLRRPIRLIIALVRSCLAIWIG